MNHLTLVILLAVAVCRCQTEKVTFGEIETLATFSFHSEINAIAREIVEDQWLPGNKLVSIGSAVFTVSPFGKTTLIAGQLGCTDWRKPLSDDPFCLNVLEHSLNDTAGLAQISNSTLIISDWNNHCLRKLDRKTGQLEVFAGFCSTTYWDCIHKSQGYLNDFTFCNPGTLKFVKESNELVVIDEHIQGGRECRIDLTTDRVSCLTLFTDNASYPHLHLSRSSLSQNGTVENKIYMAAQSGIAEVKFGQLNWILGCEEKSPISNCSNSLDTSVSLSGASYVIREQNVLLASDFSANTIYIIDLVENRFTSLCEVISCPLMRPAGLKVIGGYLYIGEFPRYTTDTSRIYRVKLTIEAVNSDTKWVEQNLPGMINAIISEAEITTPWTINWADLDENKQTTTPFTESDDDESWQNSGSSSGGHGYYIGGGVGGVVVIPLCICFGVRKKRRYRVTSASVVNLVQNDALSAAGQQRPAAVVVPPTYQEACSVSPVATQEEPVVSPPTYQEVNSNSQVVAFENPLSCDSHNNATDTSLNNSAVEESENMTRGNPVSYAAGI